VLVYYRLIGSTSSRPPAVTVDKPWDCGVRGLLASLLPYGASVHPAHILSLAYKSKFTHVRTWDLNAGPETNHFTELSFPVSETLAVRITIVVRESITRSLPHEDSLP
jgi:hypothetical protein